ncbi:type II toxin-antitoxin system RelE/ParE family toxin [Nocardiopsis flavescens]|uniref:mRNA interferase RelE/StbE n=1 Tax=Nocardiopsis flavescens TaxID=758803 RepID=A0A1M6EEP6_9ACTN|nr:type II toxin-antitoxin system RelE/ParE family toxin [Nocardiopsis flavescens]SHI83956.1 mRNA interferase RelE/StbE [Nocardiopsis flavescens]
MTWRVELHDDAQRELRKLDPQAVRRILRFLGERIEGSSDPRELGEALKGNRLGDLWRYRVGDYRIIADVRDDVVVVLVLHVKHRREVYRG